MLLKAMETELLGAQRMKKPVLNMLFVVIGAWANAGTAF
jgi:hypothetical protein